MGHTAPAEAFHPDLWLPVACFNGPDAAYLESEFSGASNLANTTLELVLAHRPEFAVQVTRMLARGRLHMAATFVAPNVGSLLVEVHIGDHGNSAGLNTLQKTDEVPHEAWELVWARSGLDNEYDIVEAARRTLRAGESYSYVGAIPEFSSSPTPSELAAIGGLGLRAAELFEEHANALRDVGAALRLLGLQIQASRTAALPSSGAKAPVALLAPG